jgi:hypothetical protein
MTHPTGGTLWLIRTVPRRGVHDSIRDGANRIDAREPLSDAAAAGRLPQQHTGRTFQGVYVSTLGGQKQRKSFWNFSGVIIGA